MKSIATMLVCSISACLSLGGCASTQTQSHVFLMAPANSIAMTTLEVQRADAHRSGSTTSGQFSPPGRTTAAFHLGAGDALGQAIYANYAVLARANAGWQYAGASTLE